MVLFITTIGVLLSTIAAVRGFRISAMAACSTPLSPTTTMLGLMVAAPLLGLYTYISEKVSSLTQILEEKASNLLSKVS